MIKVLTLFSRIPPSLNLEVKTINYFSAKLLLFGLNTTDNASIQARLWCVSHGSCIYPLTWKFVSTFKEQ